jgi:hypothetical protein
MRHIKALDGSLIEIESGDIVLSRYHGNWKGRTLAKLITWIPGVSRHTGYSHAMMFGEKVHASRLVSAEGGCVQLVDFDRYQSSDYSIVILRDPKLTEATRLRAAIRADELLGTKYSYWAIAAHGIDTILSFGGRLPWSRPVAGIVGRLDRGEVCSEMVAHAYWDSVGLLFKRWKSSTSVDWWVCRPRDIEYTARIEGWKVVHLTSHGAVVKG